MADAKTRFADYVWNPWRPVDGALRRAVDSTWKKPLAWNRKAECDRNCNEYTYAECPGTAGPCIMQRYPIVFLSLLDPFEDWSGPIVGSKGKQLCYPTLGPAVTRRMNDDDLRRDMFDVIDQCPNLRFVLATERPERVRGDWPCPLDTDGDGDCHVCYRGRPHYRPNVHLLFSASGQETLEAGLPRLLKCRDLVPVIGVKVSGGMDFSAWLSPPAINPFTDMGDVPDPPPIDWVTVDATADPVATESIVDQCQAAGVPCFVEGESGPKQYPEENHG